MQKEGLAFWNTQNVRKVIRPCPNTDFPRDNMHGVNISNHTRSSPPEWCKDYWKYRTILPRICTT